MAEENSVDEEVMIEFRRFPQEKQDQIRALVNYATLMGLNGKDLVSIGGKLDRIKIKRELDSNRELVKGMNIRVIGRDRDCNTRWAWTDSSGVLYHFTNSNYHSITITNTVSKKGLRQHFNTYDLPDVGRWSYMKNHMLAPIMLGVYNGDIKLP